MTRSCYITVSGALEAALGGQNLFLESLLLDSCYGYMVSAWYRAKGWRIDLRRLKIGLYVVLSLLSGIYLWGETWTVIDTDDGMQVRRLASFVVYGSDEKPPLWADWFFT